MIEAVSSYLENIYPVVHSTILKWETLPGLFYNIVNNSFNFSNPTLNGERVVFLLEDHSNQATRAKNIKFLFDNYSFERGDIILVEDDCQKSKDELNLVQIGDFNSNQARIEGWDDHESCITRKKIADQLHRIEDLIEKIEANLANSNDLAYIHQFAKQVKILTDSEGHQTSQQIANKVKSYLSRVKGHIALQHFEIRQKSLTKSVQEALDNSGEGIVFVLAGSLHITGHDPKISKFVQEMLTSFSSYLIV